MDDRERLPLWAATAVDIGLGVLFAGALALQAYWVAVSWGGASWLFDLGAGAVVCALALLRRRGRLATAAAGLGVASAAVVVAWAAQLPAEPGLAMAAALAVLVGAAVRALPPLPAGAVAAGGLAVVLGSALAAVASPSSMGAATLNAAAWSAALAAGLGARTLDARRRSIVARVRSEERLELARELHDVVAHHITGIVVEAQAGWLEARKRPGGGAREEGFARIEAAGSDALAATRRVVGLLRGTDAAVSTAVGPTAAGAERLSAIEDLVGRFEDRDDLGPVVRLQLPPDHSEGGDEPPPEVSATCYRVVQEALTNIARHAPNARSVEVGVLRAPDSVTVEITDDAPAPAARSVRRLSRGGYGLVGMRERVEALGGRLEAGPRSGTVGWSVRAVVPITEGGVR